MFLLYFKCACAQVYVRECECMNEYVCPCMSLLEWQVWVPWDAPGICSLSPVPPRFLPADTSPALGLSPAVLKNISSKGATFLLRRPLGDSRGHHSDSSTAEIHTLQNPEELSIP